MSDLKTEKECSSIESGLHSIVISHFNIDTPIFYHHLCFFHVVCIMIISYLNLLLDQCLVLVH